MILRCKLISHIFLPLTVHFGQQIDQIGCSDDTDDHAADDDVRFVFQKAHNCLLEMMIFAAGRAALH